MKRRKVLTSASVLAGAALTGCGGGGEDGALGGDPSSQIGAYTIPRNLVPTNTEYQVEVVFQSTRTANVYMFKTGWGVGRLLAAKDETTGISHRLGMALFRCTSTADNTNADFWLAVQDDQGRYIYAGTANTTATDYRQYMTHSDGGLAYNNLEYEWNFYSLYDKSLLVSVRFFPLPVSEHVLPSTGTGSIQVINNTSTHAHGGGLLRTLPKHHATTLQIVHHEAGVIESTSDNNDTIALPNNRRVSHDELVPSYLAASAAEKPLLKRRLLRHVDLHAKNARGSWPVTQDDDEVVNLLGNEIVRVLGGAKLVAHLNHVRDNVRTSIQNNLDNMGAAFGDFCANQLPALSSASMNTNTSNLLDDISEGWASSGIGGGAGVSTSVQAGFSITAADYPWPGIDLGGGVRVSLGLCRASYTYKSNTKSEANVYKISEIAGKGLKLGFTFIVKGFNGSELWIKGVSMDIEITVNCTVKNGNWRADSIQLDPVFDVDTRTWLGKMAAKGLARLLAISAGGTQTIAALPNALSYGAPGYMAAMGPQMGAFAGAFVTTTAGLISLGMKAKMNPAFNTFRDAFNKAVPITRYWGTLEFSPLRIVMPNSDVADPAITFRSGFRYGGVGWQPGVKYIAGFGVGPTYSVPYVAPGETKPPGTVTYTGFLRVAAVADVYAVYGGSTFIRSIYAPWEF